MKQLTQEEFTTLVKSSTKPLLVDFYATWCGPCKAMHPILENVEKSADGQAYDFIQIDVDQAPELSARFGVMAVPTLAIFKDGDMVYKQAGVHQPQQLTRVLRENA